MQQEIVHVHALANGQIQFTDLDESYNIVQKPHQTLFQTIWEHLQFYAEPHDDFSNLVIHFADKTYNWCHTMAHYCFAEGRLSEMDFAEEIRQKSN